MSGPSRYLVAECHWCHGPVIDNDQAKQVIVGPGKFGVLCPACASEADDLVEDAQ